MLCNRPFGLATDLPVVGDWDGDGKDEIGVYRPSTSQWFLDDGNNTWEGCGPDICAGPFGQLGDRPLAGNWTGVGDVDKIGVFQPTSPYYPAGSVWVLDNGNGAFGSFQEELTLGFPFGSPTGLPVKWNKSLVRGN